MTIPSHSRPALRPLIDAPPAGDALAAQLLDWLALSWAEAPLALRLAGRWHTRAWPGDWPEADLAALHGAAATVAAALAAPAQQRGLRVQLQALGSPGDSADGLLLALRPGDAPHGDETLLLEAAAVIAEAALARAADRAEIADLGHTCESLIGHCADAVIELDEAGRVRRGNAATAEVLGQAADALRGTAFAALFAEEHREMLAQRLRAALGGTAQSAQLRSAARLRELELTLVPMRRREAVTGAFALVHDVSRARAADRALRHSHEQVQRFNARLVGLNDCALRLAKVGTPGDVAGILARGLRDALDATVVRLRLRDGESAQAWTEAADRQRAGSRAWFDVLQPAQALALDRASLQARLPAEPHAAVADLPLRNWIGVPLRTGDGVALGSIELDDAAPDDDLEQTLTLVAQFAELGTAALERLRLLHEIRAAERHLVQQLAFTEAVAGSIGDAVYAVGRDGVLNYINPAGERLLGWRLAEATDAPFEPRLVPGEVLGPAARALAAAEVVRAADLVLQRRDGSRFPAACTASPLFLDGRIVGAVAVVRDHSERRRAEAVQRERDRFFALSAEIFCIADTRGHFLQVNDAFGATLGYANHVVLGRPWIELVHPEDRAPTLQAAERLYATGQLVGHRNRYCHADGSWRWLEWNARLDADGKVYAAARDITERQRIESELSFHATHDRLTGLANLEQLQAFLQARLASAALRAGRVSVFYLDLDHFHAVNETRGYSASDLVLSEIARRLRDLAGDQGLASRIASDEFVVVRDDPEGTADQGEVGDELRACVESPVMLEGLQLYLTCSIGVSCFPDNGSVPADLIHQAEAAMQQAKREGRNTVVAFSNDQRAALLDRQRLGARLRDAVRASELVLHYQPQVSVHNWQVCGVEALVRWQSPEHGLLLPGRFIQVAEDMGQIVEIGQWVLDTACRQAREWLDEGVADFTVAVNVSGLQLQRPDFLERVRRALDASRLPPRYLELELTESIIMGQVERVIDTMRALKAMGVMISLDDFGSGYSSLSYLRRFPIHKLKIDQSFVRDTVSDASAAGICRSIIGLGHQLGLTVSAEGVETIGQVGFLRRAECDQFQGNYFSTPLPARQTFEMLRRRYVSGEHVAPIDSATAEGARTLLLVDDEENVLRALVRLLRRDGYQILVATRPLEAMEILASQPVQVILSDQRMPGQSGTEFLSLVKEMYPDTVRLILSGYSDLSSLTDAINRGAVYRYIAKPWDDDDLRRQIREAFRLYETRLAAARGG